MAKLEKIYTLHQFIDLLLATRLIKTSLLITLLSFFTLYDNTNILNIGIINLSYYSLLNILITIYLYLYIFILKKKFINLDGFRINIYDFKIISLNKIHLIKTLGEEKYYTITDIAELIFSNQTIKTVLSLSIFSLIITYFFLCELEPNHWDVILLYFSIFNSLLLVGTIYFLFIKDTKIIKIDNKEYSLKTLKFKKFNHITLEA